MSEPEKPRTVAGWMQGLAEGEIRLDDPFASNDWGSWTAAQQREMTASFRALPEEAKDEVTNTLLGASAAEMVGSEFAAQVLARAASRDEETFDRWRVTSAVQNHAINWMLDEPDAAARWVDTLPWNHVGREARREMVRAWGGYDPEAAQRWVERMPADERERMQGVLEAGM